MPWLWFLGHTSDCRIFQNLNVPDIIEQVFKTYGFTDYQMSVSRGDYPKLDFCVQYRESALNFVSRLMEEVGIFYFFRHDDDRHVLVMGDSNVSFRDLPDPKLIYAPQNVQSGQVTQWEHAYDFRPGRWAQKDFNFETPSGDLQTSEKTVLNLNSAETFERFDYPGRYVDKGLGTKLTRTLMEAEEAAYHAVRGASSYRYLSVGGKFSLQRHPCQEEAKQYVVRRVRHEATDNSYLTSDAEPSRYDNTFEAMPYDVPFRPLRVTEKPFVHGPQTAIVVGPPGEKIFTDKHGRVRVQFHWDRYGKKDDKSSCWIRVSHGRAGSGWGDVTLPHVGHEVVVSFLEGDPDRPLVTGRVYNGENANAIGMPENKTQTGLRDHSGNEIVMEGKGGVEDIRVHAVKDMHVIVDNDREKTIRVNETTKIGGHRDKTVNTGETVTVNGGRSHTVNGTHTTTISIAEVHSVGAGRMHNVGAAEVISVGAARTVTVGAIQAVTVGASHRITVGSDQTVTVGGNQRVTVSGKETNSVGKDRASEIGENETINAGKTVTISAADQIMLKTGSATLTMKKNGDITIEGKQINIKGSGNVIVKGQNINHN